MLEEQEISIYDLAKLMMNAMGLDHDITLYPSPNGSVRRRCPDVRKLRKLLDSLKVGVSKKVSKRQRGFTQGGDMVLPGCDLCVASCNPPRMRV